MMGSCRRRTGSLAGGLGALVCGVLLNGTATAQAPPAKAAAAATNPFGDISKNKVLTAFQTTPGVEIEWLNTGRSIEPEELRGKFVLLSLMVSGWRDGFRGRLGKMPEKLMRRSGRVSWKHPVPASDE